MNIIAKLFVEREFPIEAERAAVLECQDSEVAGANGSAEGVGKAGSPEFGLAGLDQDLVGLYSGLTAQVARLSEEIIKAKTAAPREDEFAQFAKAAINFLDAMDRIVEMGKSRAQSEEMAAWHKSVDAAHQRILRLFEKHGLQQLSCLGQEVDLDRQEVVEYRPTKEHPHNTVIEDRQKGIIFRGKVLRDARVVVACNEDEEALH